jgi:hypothetical protein
MLKSPTYSFNTSPGCGGIYISRIVYLFFIAVPALPARQRASLTRAWQFQASNAALAHWSCRSGSATLVGDGIRIRRFDALFLAKLAAHL